MKEQNDILKQNVTNGFHQSVPSSDFTDKVMSKIDVLTEKELIYEPLISKKWWTIVSITSITLILFSFIFESQHALPNLLGDITLPNLENYKTSFQLSGLILVMLCILTLTDLVYRKYKHI
jgi:phosphatidylglycerophosphate synthase